MQKLLLELNETDLRAFIAVRRQLRTQKVYKSLTKPAKEVTVGTIAKDLGLDKAEVLKRIEEELK